MGAILPRDLSKFQTTVLWDLRPPLFSFKLPRRFRLCNLSKRLALLHTIWMQKKIKTGSFSLGMWGFFCYPYHHRGGLTFAELVSNQWLTRFCSFSGSVPIFFSYSILFLASVSHLLFLCTICDLVAFKHKWAKPLFGESGKQHR